MPLVILNKMRELQEQSYLLLKASPLVYYMAVNNINYAIIFAQTHKNNYFSLYGLWCSHPAYYNYLFVPRISPMWRRNAKVKSMSWLLSVYPCHWSFLWFSVGWQPFAFSDIWGEACAFMLYYILAAMMYGTFWLIYYFEDVVDCTWNAIAND